MDRGEHCGQLLAAANAPLAEPLYLLPVGRAAPRGGVGRRRGEAPPQKQMEEVRAAATGSDGGGEEKGYPSRQTTLRHHRCWPLNLPAAPPLDSTDAAPGPPARAVHRTDFPSSSRMGDTHCCSCFLHFAHIYLPPAYLAYLNYSAPSLISNVEAAECATEVNLDNKVDAVSDKDHASSEDTLISSDSKKDPLQRRIELLMKSELAEALVETCVETVWRVTLIKHLQRNFI